MLVLEDGDDPDAAPRPLAVGDPHDDDAKVREDQIRETNKPVDTEDLPIVAVAPSAPLKPLTRLLTGTVTIQPTWQPTQILQSDPYRQYLRVSARSLDSSNQVTLLGDDAGKVFSPSSALTIASGDSVAFNVDCTHTGPVWVSCPTSSVAIIVSYVAVTRG